MSKVKMDPLQFVESLELGTPKKAIERLNAPSRVGIESTEGAKAESYLSNKSIVSFTSTVSNQNRQDILSSTLLAQLAADRKFAAEEKLEDWFNVYQQTLNNIGWVVQGKDFSRFSDSKSAFEMQNVIIDILSTALGGNAIAILAKTLEAFKKLSDSDNKIIAFEKNTHTLSKGTFLIALCDQTEDSISMKIGAFQLTASNTIHQILFFKSSSDNTSLHYATTDATFNNKAYSVVRLAIEQKLESKFSQYVAELDI